jgi:hypothetical protein
MLVSRSRRRLIGRRTRRDGDNIPIGLSSRRNKVVRPISPGPKYDPKSRWVVHRLRQYFVATLGKGVCHYLRAAPHLGATGEQRERETSILSLPK